MFFSDLYTVFFPAGYGIQANILSLHSKSASEYYDPCQDFADRSLKCMKRNAFDREMCHDYFQ